MLTLAAKSGEVLMATTGTASADSLDGTSGADTIDGLAGADTINGLAGADSLTGGDGNDTIDSGAGSDTVQGGAGDDKILDSAGSDLINGGNGVDTITVTRSDASSTDVVTLNGGAGADVITFTGAAANAAEVSVDGGTGGNTITVQDAAEATVKSGYGADTVKISGADHAVAHTGGGDDRIEASMREGGARVGIGAGAGDDKITLHLDHDAKFTLHMLEGMSGDGQDVVTLAALTSADQDNAANIAITGFETGDGGDQLNMSAYFNSIFSKDRSHDWFENGHLRLVQSGGDARLLIDVDGTGNEHDWQTLALFKETDAHDLTAFNLGGVDPVVTDASGDLVV
jgi:Ca2+-binding RTX toxin-like protein